jgi:hypothetical protein
MEGKKNRSRFYFSNRKVTNKNKINTIFVSYLFCLPLPFILLCSGASEGYLNRPVIPPLPFPLLLYPLWSTVLKTPYLLSCQLLCIQIRAHWDIEIENWVVILLLRDAESKFTASSKLESNFKKIYPVANVVDISQFALLQYIYIYIIYI